MRTVEIPVHNNQILEIFTQNRGMHAKGFEVWMVGVSKGERMVLDHFITHHDLERQLSYARPGDLVWTDAVSSAIPSQKHPSALEFEQTIERETYIDTERLIYLFNATIRLRSDRKTANNAKRAILGRWTDGVATVTFMPGSKLRVECPDLVSHPLYVADRRKADWWNLSSWLLFMHNEETKSGEKVKVLRCDERELHLANLLGERRNTLVHVFHRDGSLQS